MKARRAWLGLRLGVGIRVGVRVGVRVRVRVRFRAGKAHIEDVARAVGA